MDVLQLTLEELILQERCDESDPMDDYWVENFINKLRLKINLHEGNITEEEFNNLWVEKILNI